MPLMLRSGNTPPAMHPQTVASASLPKTLLPTCGCRFVQESIGGRTHGFVLTAETPGLRKDELKVELVDASDHCVLEVSGQTAVKPAATDAAKDTDADANVGPTDAGKPQELRATYRAFKERVRLPQGVDREAMRAKYEDGLLVVTIPRVKTDGVKRRAIALN